MKRRGHVPIRMCVGCGERAEQHGLLRFAADGAGGFSVVTRGGRGGRTAYLHRDAACWERFRSRKGLIRSLAGGFGREVRGAFVDGLRAGAAARS